MYKDCFRVRSNINNSTLASLHTRGIILLYSFCPPISQRLIVIITSRSFTVFSIKFTPNVSIYSSPILPTFTLTCFDLPLVSSLRLSLLSFFLERLTLRDPLLGCSLILSKTLGETSFF